ncbi:MAG: FAD-dependent oxidoreductase [Myxococcota bacterium]|nr:FAD-dependent oxidoreductase [Myxococcota bacterium]
MTPRYDVGIVGASVAGCTTALACAKAGARVLLLEADPNEAAAQHVGAWLHPDAMDALEGLGVDLVPPVGYPTGKGYVLFPEDGTEAVVLPYSVGRFGFSLPQGLLVETLRQHCDADEAVTLRSPVRASRVDAGTLTWQERGRPRSARVEHVVFAAGADVQPIKRGAGYVFGAIERPPTHRIASLDLVGATLPFEGFRHVFVGGCGVAIAHRVGPATVRLALDVPLGFRVPREGGVQLLEAYAPSLPEELALPFAEALRRGAPSWSHGRIQPRGNMIRGGIARVGDAAGSLHPLTAAGPSLAIADGVAFAESRSPASFARKRRRDTRLPEAIAIGLAEVLTDEAPESVAIRRAMYNMWRDDPGERLRTMSYIAGENEGLLRFGGSCLRVMLSSAARVAKSGARGELRHAHRTGSALLERIGWMVGGALGWSDLLPDAFAEKLEARGTTRYLGALHHTGEAEVVGLPARSGGASSIQTALARGAQALVNEQAEDGSFEGEVVWCPMLAAQYVLASHVMDRPIDPERRRLLLRHFEDTLLPGGAWGLHEKSEPYLFVTTLVYVAARLLGVDKDDALIREAKAFIRQEGGAVGIPSWGKLWLALVDLYAWEGVNPVVPELWATPRWLPMHPSRYYCHTRLIYMGMAALYGGRVRREANATIRCVRDEIFLQPYGEIDFDAARETLREGDVHDAPGPLLKLSYRLLTRFEQAKSDGLRQRLLGELRDKIRYELRSTHYTCISPVSGMLGLLALHANDPSDPDLVKGLEGFEGWIWEDEQEGARIAGARSATWDTAFAAQALAAAAGHVDVSAPLERADAFLASQQIRRGTGLEGQHDRLDPTGGYCFAGVWHGWPVSDCTAEAMLARLHNPAAKPSARAMEQAAEFVLRCQNADGGFGSYEARRHARLSIDWLNPSEMFGACMTERSYVECTASCVQGLAAFRERYPDRLRGRVDAAIEAGVARLRAEQRADGSFEGMWGVNFIYGTLFGVRGLLAGGVPCTDPQIRRACAWLLERQRPDGGWGEHFASVLEGRYVEHEEAQVVQTAWALTCLLEAEEPDFAALERAARLLARTQRSDGTWPKQDPEGIFFHTALLEYRLYRAYFPPWALGLFASRAEARAAWTEGGRAERRPAIV